jgi:hypothetical protein
VYLAPLVTAHWIDLFGIVLARELAASGREPAWKAADFGLAVLLQGATYVAVRWTAARSTMWAVAAGALALVPLTLAINAAYLYTIPAYFLIESDAAADRSTWTDACSVDGYWLDPVPAGVSRGVERRGEAWVRSDDGVHYAILRAPACAIEPVAIPAMDLPPGLHQALPDGSVVYVTMQRGAGGQSYWLLNRGASRPIALSPPDGAADAAPVVSDDGTWVGWLLRSEARDVSLRIARVAGGEAPIMFTHPLLQRATVVALELDMRGREVTINRTLSTFVRLRLDGTTVWGPLAPGDIAAQAQTFRHSDRQWLAWDAYVENGRYRLAWSTRAGEGRREIPKGRGITAGALDPRGRYLAVSTTTALNIGAIRDTVLVVRATDGSDVFRRSLPPYTRSQVAFLGEDFFAYSEIVDGRGRTRLLRIVD